MRETLNNLRTGILFSIGFYSLLNYNHAKADYFPFPPLQDQICDNSSRVDKDKLIEYLLNKYPINMVVLKNDNGKIISLREFFSSQALLNSKDCAKCSVADKANLEAIRGSVASILAGTVATSYKPTNRSINPAQYFEGDDAFGAVQCIKVQGHPVEPPGAQFMPPPSSQSPIRIRGTAADLYIDRSDDKDFASSSKATIDFSNDGTAKTQTDTFVADIGYFVPNIFKEEGANYLDVIPYAGVNRKIVTVDVGSKAMPSANETADFGVMANRYQFLGSYIFPLLGNNPLPFSNLISLTPDYLFNFQDDSRLFTFKMQDIPEINDGINSYFPIISGNDNFVSMKIIFDVRADFGAYSDRGIAAVAASHKAFLRFGGQAGLAFVSDNPYVPVSLSVTYTGLYGAAGGVNIGEFITSGSYFFDPKKYFALSVSYENGVRQDTAVREQKWDVGLSAHF